MGRTVPPNQGAALDVRQWNHQFGLMDLQQPVHTPGQQSRQAKLAGA